MYSLDLPDKPSELIRVALKDLEIAEAAENIIINMNVFHLYDINTNKCKVCLAGAVMRRSCSDTETVSAHEFSKAEQNKLHALDCFRFGLIRDGLNCMEIKNFCNEMPHWFSVTPYGFDSTQFKIDMEKLATYLENQEL